MKLFELTHEVTIQGDIRLSVWKDGEEKKVKTLKCVDDLSNPLWCNPNILGWKDMEVTYIFCPGDGLLHIELAESEG